MPTRQCNLHPQNIVHGNWHHCHFQITKIINHKIVMQYTSKLIVLKEAWDAASKLINLVGFLKVAHLGNMMSCNGFASICFNQKTIPPHFHSCHPWLWLSRELKSNRKLCWSWPHLGKENESIMLEHFGWWAKDKKGKAGMLNASVKAWKVYQLPASLLLYMRDVYVCALKALR